MSKWKYRKPEPSYVQGMCVVCGDRPQMFTNERGAFLPYCRACKKALHGNGNGKRQRKRADLKARPYVVYKKSVCEECGCVPEHSRQLDVDHVDENHSNNDPSNLKTLCANCHRLKTHYQRLR